MKKVLLIISILVIISCRDSETKISENNKIPKDAFWVDSNNGGNWFVIESIHNHRNNALISIYDGKTGEKIISKRFLLICNIENQNFIKDLSKQIKSFDGKKIYLKNKNTKEPCWLQ